MMGRLRVGAVSGAATLALGVAGGCGGSSAAPAPACDAPAWVGAWSADPSDAANHGLADQTSRTILTPHLGGDTLRVRVSNRFGGAGVTFQAASVGLRRGSGAALAAGSRRPLTFAGAASVTVAAGDDAVSDPVALRVAPGDDLAVSLFAAGLTGPATEHSIGQQTSYVTPPGAGDHTGEDAGGAFSLPIPARFFVSGVDVRAPSSVGDVVALGDSITDGFGGPADRNDRYPDFLARRLAGRGLSVVNAGISGNRVLSDARAQLGGPSALARLDRDVVGQPGVSDVVVLEGINDIAGQAPADRVTGGLEQIVTRLHGAGLRVQLGTLTPFGGSPAAAAAEATRRAVNRWIRSGAGGADGVVDFDAAVRDPGSPDRLDPRYDSGDHLHPNGAGRRAMAGAVDPAGLRGAACRG
jgi:lysophospholipase L1-like esterase